MVKQFQCVVCEAIFDMPNRGAFETKKMIDHRLTHPLEQNLEEKIWKRIK